VRECSVLNGAAAVADLTDSVPTLAHISGTCMYCLALHPLAKILYTLVIYNGWHACLSCSRLHSCSKHWFVASKRCAWCWSAESMTLRSGLCWSSAHSHGSMYLSLDISFFMNVAAVGCKWRPRIRTRPSLPCVLAVPRQQQQPGTAASRGTRGPQECRMHFFALHILYELFWSREKSLSRI
jgi:sugar phosphate permease